VGRRLALNALAKDYGKTLEFSGPVAINAQKSGKQIIITYDHAERLKTRGFVGKLVGFEVAGKQGAFVPVRNAKISGSTVVIDPGIPSPVYVRYAWECFPDANLYNSAELPAVPFKMKIG
jgi:sialate O-acetylesterase